MEDSKDKDRDIDNESDRGITDKAKDMADKVGEKAKDLGHKTKDELEDLGS